MPTTVLRWITLPMLLLCCLGCAPTIKYRIDTAVLPTGACQRTVLVQGISHPRLKQQVKLQDYLDLPEADAYEHFVLEPSSLKLGGRFTSPLMIPSDFVKPTLHSEEVARNRILFRHIDLVLVAFMDYEERIDDIVNRLEGERALRKLVDMILDELILALESRFGEDHDLTGLKQYLRAEFPTLALRLYSRLWEIRRARRGGVAFLSEDKEWNHFVGEEARRYGIDLQPGSSDEVEKHNRQAITDFANRKLRELTTPIAGGTEPLNIDFLHDKNAREALLQDLQASVKERHGSTQAFVKKLEPLLPEALGAFLINQYSLLPTNPHLDFQVRLALPGTVIQTNGLIDVNGKLLWSFSEGDMGLSGFAMWARSLIVNQKAIDALRLEDFPGGLNTVERFFRPFRGPGGRTNEELVELLRTCVKEESLGPLAARAAEGDKNDSMARAAAALHTLLKSYQKPANGNADDETDTAPAEKTQPADEPDPDPGDSEVEELGGHGLTAPGRGPTPEIKRGEDDAAGTGEEEEEVDPE